MIPRLPTEDAPGAAYVAFLDALTVLATDNSIYRQVPQAIAFPRGTEDLARVARLLAEPRFAWVRIAPRGGGTGTNGQSLTDGLAVDVSRRRRVAGSRRSPDNLRAERLGGR